MKIPDFLAQHVQSQGDSYTLQITKQQWRWVLTGFVLLLVVTSG